VSDHAFWTEQAVTVDPAFRAAPPAVAERFTFDGERPVLLQRGAASCIRLRPPREARAWGNFEADLARLRRRPVRVVR
jgi:hypothetical protein